MNKPHHNARACVCRREQIVLRHQQSEAVDDRAKAFGISVRTACKGLKRLGLNRRDRLNPPEPVRRYERDRPGDLIHLDIKKLGRFMQTGHRIKSHHRRTRSRHLGYDDVHLAIDDHSFIAYVEVLDDEKGKSCAHFLAWATQLFSKQGVTVRRVMTAMVAPYEAQEGS